MNYKFIKYSKSISLKKFLKKKMPEKTKVFRYNFHKNKNDKDQLMMIWQVKNYFFLQKNFSILQKYIFY